MATSRLQGLIAAAVTPFSDDGTVDLDQIGPVTERLLAAGVTGLYVCGSTGEGVSLTSAERKAVTEAYVAAANGRATVIAQVGHNSQIEACALAKHAAEIGVDVLSATCPSYFKVSTVAGLIDYLRPVADAGSGLPFYYYHIPALTGSQVNIVDFLERVEPCIPSFAGLKYTKTLLHEFQSCQNAADGKFDIVWGCDEMLLGAIATGAEAAIGSTYNVATPLYQKIWDAVIQGDLETARSLQLLSVQMVDVLAANVFHASLKATLQMLGMHVGACRSPIGSLDRSQHETLRDGLSRIGFFDWCGMERSTSDH